MERKINRTRPQSTVLIVYFLWPQNLFIAAHAPVLPSVSQQNASANNPLWKFEFLLRTDVVFVPWMNLVIVTCRHHPQVQYCTSPSVLASGVAPRTESTQGFCSCVKIDVLKMDASLWALIAVTVSAQYVETSATCFPALP